MKSCPSDESVEYIDPYEVTLDSDNNIDGFRTVTQDEDQPSPSPSRPPSVAERKLDAGASHLKLDTGANTLKPDTGAGKPKLDTGASMKLDAGANTVKPDSGAGKMKLDAGASKLKLDVGANMTLPTMGAVSQLPHARDRRQEANNGTSPKNPKVSFRDMPSTDTIQGMLQHQLQQLLPKMGETLEMEAKQAHLPLEFNQS